MKTIDNYIIRLVVLTFLGSLTALTAVVWVTQVLRELDLITNKGQTIGLFLQIAAYLIPMLVLIIMPIALFVGVVQSLNKLSNDSELIVLTAAGITPRQFVRPFIMISIVVMMIVSALSLYFAPAAIRQLRILGNKAQSNIIATVIKPGRFMNLQDNLVFHIREREGSGLLKGILISDTRDKEIHLTTIAEEGQVVENAEGTYLVLEKGFLQRKNIAQGDVALVAFDKYAFDLSQFASAGEAQFRPSEKTLAELLNPNPNDYVYKQSPGRFRQELHDRITAGLYPLIFTLIALAYLREAKTTRQGRTGAILSAIASLGLVKVLSLVVSSANAATPEALKLVYGLPLFCILFFGGAAFGLFTLSTPDKFFYWLAVKRRALINRLKMRLGFNV